MMCLWLKQNLRLWIFKKMSQEKALQKFQAKIQSMNGKKQSMGKKQ